MKVTMINATKDFLKSISAIQKSSWGQELDLDTTEEEGKVILMQILKGEMFGGTALESIKFTFAVEGVSLTCTHQLVRARIGVGFGQCSFRDNDVTNFHYIIPESIKGVPDLEKRYCALIEQSRVVYYKMIKECIPYQDARFACLCGIGTNIIVTINYQALLNLCQNRLCNSCQWEINELCRNIREKIRQDYDEILADFLRPRCDYIGRCINKSTVFPCCGKFNCKEVERTTFGTEQNANMKWLEQDKKSYEEWRQKYYGKQ